MQGVSLGDQPRAAAGQGRAGPGGPAERISAAADLARMGCSPAWSPAHVTPWREGPGRGGAPSRSGAGRRGGRPSRGALTRRQIREEPAPCYLHGARGWRLRPCPLLPSAPGLATSLGASEEARAAGPAPRRPGKWGGNGLPSLPARPGHVKPARDPPPPSRRSGEWPRGCRMPRPGHRGPAASAPGARRATALLWPLLFHSLGHFLSPQE